MWRAATTTTTPSSTRCSPTRSTASRRGYASSRPATGPRTSCGLSSRTPATAPQRAGARGSDRRPVLATLAGQLTVQRRVVPDRPVLGAPVPSHPDQVHLAVVKGTTGCGQAEEVAGVAPAVPAVDRHRVAV